jgi:hypothetical protein
MPTSAVVIGSADLLPALVSRAGLDDQALTFSDTEPLEALQAITDNPPRVVVLERLFAATSRGAALITRLKSDPALGEMEIRVLSHTGDYSRVISRPAQVPATVTSSKAASQESSGATAEESRPLDWRGTRRAPRYRARPGVEILIDGNAVSVVDFCAIGAQVLSPGMLRPGQRVRVTLEREKDALRFRSSVAWARFELPRRAGDPGPHYRAGLEFLDADVDEVEAYCLKNKA